MTPIELLQSVRRLEVRSKRPKCRFLATGGRIWPKCLGEKTFSNGGSRRKIGGRHREIGGNVPNNGGSTRGIGGNGRENGGSLPEIGGNGPGMGASLRKLGAAAGKMGAGIEIMGAMAGKSRDRLRTLGGKPENGAAGTSCRLFPSNLTGLANAATRLVNRHS